MRERADLSKIETGFGIRYGSSRTSPRSSPRNLPDHQEKDRGNDCHAVIVLRRGRVAQPENEKNDHDKSSSCRPQHLRHPKSTSALLFRSLFVFVHELLTPGKAVGYQ